MQSIKKFIIDLRAEFMKVEWPTLREVTTLTLLVVVLCFVMSIYLGLFDLGITRLLSKINIL